MEPDATLEEARTEGLVAEIERYLAAIDLFRELGHEPRWRREVSSSLAARIAAWSDARTSQTTGV